MLSFVITSIAFIKEVEFNNGENKANDIAVNLETLLEWRVKKSENLKSRDIRCNLRITFLRKRTQQLE